jgi:hypothetical protein
MFRSESILEDKKLLFHTFPSKCAGAVSIHYEVRFVCIQVVSINSLV